MGKMLDRTWQRKVFPKLEMLGEWRLDAIFQEAESTADFLPGPPTVPTDFAAELAQLKACV